MRICNKLLSESFSYQKTGKKITDRIEDIESLDEVIQFCKKIEETVVYTLDLSELFIKVTLNA